MERLQRILAARGVSSRRAAEDLIKAGRVNVDGTIVTELGSKADPIRSVIKVDGKILKAQRPRYILMNKPRGYITTVKDERDRRTVMDLVTIPERVYPVGRLDRDTEGLLLLTNDGDVANRVMHPRYELDKEYQVLTLARPTDDTLQRLRDGIVIEGKRIVPEEVRVIRETNEGLIIKIVVHEGLNHLVRRMMDAVGIPVERLRRMRVGPLMVTGIQLGTWRELTSGELRGLLEALHLDRAEDPDFAPKPVRVAESATTGKKGTVKPPKRGGYGPKSPRRQQQEVPQDPLDLLDFDGPQRRDQPFPRDNRAAAQGRDDRGPRQYEQPRERSFESRDERPQYGQRPDSRDPSGFEQGRSDRRYSPPDDNRRRQNDRQGSPPRRSEAFQSSPEYDRNSDQRPPAARPGGYRDDRGRDDRAAQRDPFQRPAQADRGQRAEKVNTGRPDPNATGRRSRQRPTNPRNDAPRSFDNRPDRSRPDTRVDRGPARGYDDAPRGSFDRADGQNRPPYNDRPAPRRDDRPGPSDDRGYRGPTARRDSYDRGDQRETRYDDRRPQQGAEVSPRGEYRGSAENRYRDRPPVERDQRPQNDVRGGERSDFEREPRRYSNSGGPGGRPDRPYSERPRGPVRPPGNSDGPRRAPDRDRAGSPGPRIPNHGPYGKNQRPRNDWNEHSERGQARTNEQGITPEGDRDRRSGGSGQDDRGARPRQPGRGDLS